MDASYKSLRGKVAIVTGASGLIGTALCKALAGNGTALGLFDVSPSVHGLAEVIEAEFAIPVAAYECDISCPQDAQKAVADCAQKLGNISLLFNNAATKTANLADFMAPFEVYDYSTWREVMNVNIDAMFIMAQAVGKRIVSSGTGGSIVQTSSIYGLLGPDQRIYENIFHQGAPINTPAVYSASKAAVVGLTKYLATYWASKGIRVNAVTPGGVANEHDQRFVDNYAERTPLRRMGKPEEIVEAMLFLASDAASYMTGQNIVVDGGWTAW